MQAAAVDPGSVASSIWRTKGFFARPEMKLIIRTFYAPTQDGAAAVLHACRCDMPHSQGMRFVFAFSFGRKTIKAEIRSSYQAACRRHRASQAGAASM